MMTSRYFINERGEYIGAFAVTVLDEEVFYTEPPEGSVEVPFAPDDARMVWNGEYWADMPKPNAPTRSDIEAGRLIAYADPLTGSDRLFSEVMRMQIMSEDGYQDVRALAIARFEEIQAKYPWPAE